jgi:hypothetical protein
MRRYRVSCYDSDERLGDLTIEAPNKAVAEMMVLTQLQAAGTPLVDRIDKLVVLPEGEPAETEQAFDDGAKPIANEGIEPNEPSHERTTWDEDIRVYDPERLSRLASYSGIPIKRAIIVGTLSATAGIAWVAWNSFHSAGGVPSVFPIQKLSSPVSRIGSDISISSQSATVSEAPQQLMQVVATQGKIDNPVSGSTDRPESIETATPPVSRTKTTAAVQQKKHSVTAPNKPKTQPTPFPETRPTTVEGWVIRDVGNGRVVLQGPNGVWKVAQGDTVPGLGRVDSIVSGAIAGLFRQVGV